jgi:DNA-binding transcriptional ArsR family regulator
MGYTFEVSRLDGAFAALADPTRREILHRISRHPQPAGALARGFRMSQPAVSKHLRVLREVNLVEVEEQGRQRIYRLSRRGIDDVRDYVEEVSKTWQIALASFKTYAETRT